MNDVVMERLSLPASIGVAFVDVYDGAAIRGLRCTLLDAASGRVFAGSAQTPSGFHHFPSVRPDRLSTLRSVEVLVEDERGDFLPLRVAWPPPVTLSSSGARVCRVELSTAPGRRSPAGAASLFATVCDQGGAPAAWARLTLETSDGQVTSGMSDAEGRLAIHLPFPRPERPPRDPRSPLGPPPDSIPPHALVTLTAFFDPAVSVEANATAARLPGRVQAPRQAAWLAAPRVVARADSVSPTPLTTVRFDLGQASVPRTAGRSELLLSPV